MGEIEGVINGEQEGRKKALGREREREVRTGRREKMAGN